jgi:hypothetical protein
LVCCNASSLEWKGRQIVRANRRVLRCELSGGDPMNVVSSDPELITVDNAVWKALTNSSPVPVKTI